MTTGLASGRCPGDSHLSLIISHTNIGRCQTRCASAGQRIRHFKKLLFNLSCHLFQLLIYFSIEIFIDCHLQSLNKFFTFTDQVARFYLETLQAGTKYVLISKESFR